MKLQLKVGDEVINEVNLYVEASAKAASFAECENPQMFWTKTTGKNSCILKDDHAFYVSVGNKLSMAIGAKGSPSPRITALPSDLGIVDAGVFGNGPEFRYVSANALEKDQIGMHTVDFEGVNALNNSPDSAPAHYTAKIEVVDGELQFDPQSVPALIDSSDKNAVNQLFANYALLYTPNPHAGIQNVTAFTKTKATEYGDVEQFFAPSSLADCKKENVIYSNGKEFAYKCTLTAVYKTLRTEISLNVYNLKNLAVDFGDNFTEPKKLLTISLGLDSPLLDSVIVSWYGSGTQDNLFCEKDKFGNTDLENCPTAHIYSGLSGLQIEVPDDPMNYISAHIEIRATRTGSSERTDYLKLNTTNIRVVRPMPPPLLIPTPTPGPSPTPILTPTPPSDDNNSGGESGVKSDSDNNAGNNNASDDKNANKDENSLSPEKNYDFDNAGSAGDSNHSANHGEDSTKIKPDNNAGDNNKDKNHAENTPSSSNSTVFDDTIIMLCLLIGILLFLLILCITAWIYKRVRRHKNRHSVL
jgi:hypothetical protein